MRGIGTVINVVTIVAGTGAGVLTGQRLPDRVRRIALKTVGLVVVVVGLAQAAGTDNAVYPLVALVAGGVIGELLGIEGRFEALGEHLRTWVLRRRPTQGADPRFVEGFVAATLVFGVGPLAILGAIDDGLRGEPQLLIVKSVLDGVVAVMFASTLGAGVGFSAIPIAIYQGTLTALAGAADRVLTDRMVVEMSAAGGIIVAGIGIRLLELTPIRVASLLPALVLAPIGVALFAR